jgi:hypothetical protein
MGVEIICQTDAVNAGPDIGAQFHHIEEFSHGSIPAGIGRRVNGLAERDPNSTTGDVTAATVRAAVISPTQKHEYPSVAR